MFGAFVDFDEDTVSRNRLDFARIKVSTERTVRIDEKIEIVVVGAVLCLWVVEEEGGRRRGWKRERGWWMRLFQWGPKRVKWHEKI